MKNQKGFTIIELLIASIAFTVLLVLVTFIVVQISRVYYKGIILSNTQNVDATVVNDVSKDIQFSNGSGNVSISNYTTNNIDVYCIGNNVFMFSPGVEYLGSSSNTNNIGLMYALATCPSSSSSSISTSGYQELLGLNMRVISFTVSPDSINPKLYDLNIGIAYGGDQYLCNQTVTNSCTSPDTMSTANNYSNYFNNNNTVACKLQVGDQYCATSYLNTTVANEYNLN